MSDRPKPVERKTVQKPGGIRRTALLLLAGLLLLSCGVILLLGESVGPQWQKWATRVAGGVVFGLLTWCWVEERTQELQRGAWARVGPPRRGGPD